MSTERLYLVDPYNERHIEMIRQFEIDHKLSLQYSESLGKIASSVSQEKYLQAKRDKNEIEEDLFIEKDSQIVDYCHIHGEKDVKSVKIIPASLKELERKRRIVTLATNYAMNILGMEEVFVEINPKNRGLMNYLENKGYENLGEEEDKIIYLKEREEMVNSQRMIA